MEPLANFYGRLFHASKKRLLETGRNTAPAFIAGFLSNVIAAYLSGHAIGDVMYGLVGAVASALGYIAASAPETAVRQEERVKAQYPRLSVVAIMLLRQRRTTFQSLALLIIAYATYVAWFALTSATPSVGAPAILVGGILLVLAKEWLFRFRVRSGLYGSSEREAREIVDFILSNADDIDFTDSGNRKRIISDADVKGIIDDLKGLPHGSALSH